jgi:hypothetical protein
MRIDMDPHWVEIPKDNVLLDEGIDKRDIKNGGNYIIGLKSSDFKAQ